MTMDYSDLEQYQLDGIDFVAERPIAALWADMGLGKTVMVQTALQRLRDAFELHKILVVTTKRIAEKTWQNEIAEWDHLDLSIIPVIGTPTKRTAMLALPADIHVIGRDNWKWFCDQYRQSGKRWSKPMDFDTLIMDESTTFKTGGRSGGSARWKAAARVRSGFDRCYQMTATPADNTLIHLWAQMMLLDAGQRLGSTKKSFLDRWFIPPDHAAHRWSWDPRPGAMEDICERVQDVVYLLREEDHLDLPPITYNSVPVYMDKKARARYTELRKDYVLELAPDKVISAVNAGVLWGKLVQMANGAVYDSEREVHFIHDEKIDALLELIEQKTPVLVIYWFNHDRDRILAALKKKKINSRIIAKTKDEDDWNAGRITAGLIHPMSAAHGLNLHRAGEVVAWFGQTQDLELYRQTNARLFGGHRRKGKYGVVHHITTEGTVDDGIVANREDRVHNAERMRELLLREVRDA